MLVFCFDSRIWPLIWELKVILFIFTGDVVRAGEDAINSVPILGEVTRAIGNVFNQTVHEIGKIPAVGK